METFSPSKDDVARIREILETSEDKTHLGIAFALVKAGLVFK